MAAIGLVAIATGCLAAERGVTGSPAPAAAAGIQAGDWLVRGRVIAMIPVNESARIDLIGGEVRTPAMVLPDADLTYFVTDHWAIAGQAGIARTTSRIVDSLVGDFPVGAVWSAAATASAQYHFFPGRRFKPYVGLGVNGSVPIKIEPAGGLVTEFDVDSKVGVMVQAGFDYRLAGNWYGNAEIRQIVLPAYALGNAGVNAEVRMDTLIFASGFGYRF